MNSMVKEFCGCIWELYLRCIRSSLVRIIFSFDTFVCNNIENHCTVFKSVHFTSLSLDLNIFLIETKLCLLWGPAVEPIKLGDRLNLNLVCTKVLRYA